MLRDLSTENEIYEYAGFTYVVDHTASGVRLRPVPGQPFAAGKEKHLMAARQCYLQDTQRQEDSQ